MWDLRVQASHQESGPSGADKRQRPVIIDEDRAASLLHLGPGRLYDSKVLAARRKWALFGSVAMQSSPTGLIIAGSMKIAAEDREAFAALLRDCMAETEVKAGCNFYKFTADLSDETVFHISEGWRDEAALDAHIASPQFQATLDQVGQLKVLGRDVKRYWVSGEGDLGLAAET
jgi:quinol monooxygenase YgiN